MLDQITLRPCSQSISRTHLLAIVSWCKPAPTLKPIDDLSNPASEDCRHPRRAAPLQYSSFNFRNCCSSHLLALGHLSPLRNLQGRLTLGRQSAGLMASCCPFRRKRYASVAADVVCTSGTSMLACGMRTHAYDLLLHGYAASQ